MAWNQGWLSITMDDLIPKWKILRMKRIEGRRSEKIKWPLQNLAKSAASLNFDQERGLKIKIEIFDFYPFLSCLISHCFTTLSLTLPFSWLSDDWACWFKENFSDTGKYREVLPVAVRYTFKAGPSFLKSIVEKHVDL